MYIKGTLEEFLSAAGQIEDISEQVHDMKTDPWSKEIAKVAERRNVMSDRAGALSSCVIDKKTISCLMTVFFRWLYSLDKLRTYKLFKKSIGLEEYLEFGLDRKYRQCLSSFRISAHKLQIERGRYLGKNVEERKCTDCNVIEEEIHFFCDCYKYNNSREKLYLELGNQHLFLGNDSKDKLIDILTSKKYGVIKPVCSYLYECNIC